MSALVKTSNDTPVETEENPLFAQRWVRIAAGLGLFGLCVLLAVAALRMPFVVISSAANSYDIGGSAQSENLHLVLAVTGIIGAVLAVVYAATTTTFKATFFVLGGVATGFAALLMLGAWQTVQRGTVGDPLLYAEIKKLEVVMQIGSGLWASLIAGLGILGLAVVVLLNARASAPAEATAPAPKRLF